MERYWDKTEAARAALTEEQVTKLLDYELMEKGVLAVEPLALDSVAPIALDTRRVFLLREGDGNYGAMLNVAFATIEQAEACKEAIQFIREQEGWQGPFFTRAAKTIQIVSEDLPTKDTVTASRAALTEQSRREQANEAARREHEKACTKVSEATAQIWADWHACRKAESRYQEIRDTLADYLRMTDGNEALARSFLAKAFSVEEIDAAAPAETKQAIEVA